MSNYINKLSIPSENDQIDILIPAPHDNHNHTVTVLCGPNGAGKSFLLFEIQKAISARKTGYESISPLGIKCYFEDEVSPSPRTLQFGNTWDYDSKVGILSLSKTSRQSSAGSDSPPFRDATAEFFFGILRANNLINFEDEATWKTDPNKRSELISRMPFSEGALYPAIDSYGICKFWTDTTHGQICLRRPTEELLELVQLFGDGSTQAYGSWSSGQKVMFALLLLCHHTKPNIILLDEIETHLHPNYISLILNFFRSTPGQTFITSHHPHLIFSSYVDRVIYMEADRPNGGKLDVANINFKKPATHKAPHRTISTLESDFDKIARTYELFDKQDSVLLHHAQSIVNSAQIKVLNAFVEVFSLEVKNATNKPIPDRQTMQLIEALQEYKNRTNASGGIDLLEYGAGFGRLILETAKVNGRNISESIHWHCWEPDPKCRTTLKETFKHRPRNDVNIIESMNSISAESVDAAVIANVLHELDLRNYVDALLDLTNALRPDGILIVLEMYPLLVPEKLAIPLPEGDMRDLLTKIGFEVYPTSFLVSASRIYCLVGKRAPNAKKLTRKLVERVVRNAWQKRRNDALNCYAAMQNPLSPTTLQTALGELTTIATVGRWLN